MRVKVLFIFSSTIIFTLAARVAAADRPAPPNVVLIVADDLGWRDLGVQGSTYHETPNLDALAGRGMRFTNAYAACPVCSPSRAAMLTGKYPARLHLTDWLPGRSDRPSQKLLRADLVQQLPLEETTIAEAIKPLGYVSASIGKWHLGEKPFWPENQGFDRNIGGTQTGSPPGGYFHFRTPSMSANSKNEYLTDRLTNEAIAFVAANKDRPFFLYLAHYAVHIPLQAKPDPLARFQAKPAGNSLQHNAIYAAVLASLDEGVGRLVNELERLKLTDRTVVVFISDNGGLSVHEGPNTPATSNAPLRDGKGYLYEGGTRVPLIVVWPGVVKPGSTVDVPVCGIDLYPTILEIAGVDAVRRGGIDGVSLTPILKGKGTIARDALYQHYPHYSNQGGKPGGSIREGYLKLIEFYEDNHIELYDLANDPGETRDLAASLPKDAERLRNKLKAWRESVDARMPRPNPAYVPPK